MSCNRDLPLRLQQFQHALQFHVRVVKNAVKVELESARSAGVNCRGVTQ
jgi:hypothetical protein